MEVVENQNPTSAFSKRYSKAEYPRNVPAEFNPIQIFSQQLDGSTLTHKAATKLWEI